MNQVISSVAQTAMQQSPEKQTLQNQTQQKTSFEETLQKVEQKNEQKTQVSESAIQKTQESLNNPAINKIQEELQTKYQQIPQTTPTFKSDLLPEFNMMNGRVSVLKDVMQGLQKAPDASGLRDYMRRIENNFGDVVSMMNSNKDLRPGELLTLQARMYMISQHIDVMSKVVDQMTGGVKTVLNTNI